MKLRLLLFTLLSIFYFGSNAQTIGIIGDSTPGGWVDDTDMTQDVGNPDIWTINITLIDGKAKFRQDDSWDINWGSLAFPTGTGVQGGDDIPVFAGNYDISLNTATGEYSFNVISTIGIIGDATPKGWAEDTNMYQDSADPNKYFITLDLAMGAAKFRQDDLWDVNWGSADFPMGTGVQGGDDIPVSKAGEYHVTLDIVTGEYNFEEIITFTSIGIIGDATPGGNDTDTELAQDSADPNVWAANISLTDGVAKFRANGNWDLNWGSADFPTGTGVQDGDDIPVVAGDYEVSLNTETGEYAFLEIVDFASIGIIGDATPGLWETETPMEKDEMDGAIWTLREVLTDGLLKFRANNDWPINWGAGDFPTGIGVQDGADIPIPAGEYIITFNSVTGEYTFEEIVVFASVGLAGTASPTMSWDDDYDMIKSPDNEFLFTVTADLFEGELKFRADDAWTANWGSPDFPTGIGVQEGDNIPVTAGSYAVSLLTDTGEYAFSDPSNTDNVLLPTAIKLYPNPAVGTIRLQIEDERMKGDVQVVIMDITGQVVVSQTINTLTSADIDVHSLIAGNYSVRIQNGKNLVGKKLTIVK